VWQMMVWNCDLFVIHLADLTLYGHINTTVQRTIIQQYSDWYTGR